MMAYTIKLIKLIKNKDLIIKNLINYLKII
jgi:hypothetical protein